MQHFVAVFVAGANFYFGKIVQNVKARHRHIINARQNARIAHDASVKPTRAAGAFRHRAVLVSVFAQFVAYGVKLFRGEGTFAHAGAIRFHHAHDFVDFARCNACANRHAARNGVRCRNVRVCAVIDVEHGCLGAFEQHFFPGGDVIVHQSYGIANIRGNLLGVRRIFGENFIKRKGRMVVEFFKFVVFPRQIAFQLGGKNFLVRQIADANADAVVPVHVTWTYAAFGRADFVRAFLLFFHTVHQPMIRHNDVRPVGYEHLRLFVAALF